MATESNKRGSDETARPYKNVPTVMLAKELRRLEGLNAIARKTRTLLTAELVERAKGGSHGN